MRNLGISLEARNCILVVIDYNDSDFQIVKTLPKISVDDIDSQDDIKDFFSNISSFTSENHIDNIFIRKRNKKGQYAGGPIGFKLEALIQLLDINVCLVSPATIASTVKKIDISKLEDSVHQYQIEALKAVITGSIKIAKN